MLSVAVPAAGVPEPESTSAIGDATTAEGELERAR
jgi:hypothetical protein